MIMLSCSQDTVKDYFQSHGMSFPVDTSGVTLLGCDYVNVTKEEVSTDEARQYVEDGIMFAKIYFQNKDVKSLVPGAEAITLSKPVLFRDASGKVGLMVRVTGYGAGGPGEKVRLPVERLGSKKPIWKIENFVYFNRNEFYQWEYGGWVY